MEGDWRRFKSLSEGAFLVSDSPLRVGVEVAPNGSHVKLVGVRRWFASARARLETPSPAGKPARTGGAR